MGNDMGFPVTQLLKNPSGFIVEVFYFGCQKVWGTVETWSPTHWDFFYGKPGFLFPKSRKTSRKISPKAPPLCPAEQDKIQGIFETQLSWDLLEKMVIYMFWKKPLNGVMKTIRKIQKRLSKKNKSVGIFKFSQDLKKQ